MSLTDRDLNRSLFPCVHLSPPGSTCRRNILDHKRQSWASLIFALAFVATVLAVRPGFAQTLDVLHSFTGGGDGATPNAGLRMDRSGVFYGTTKQGGANGPNGYGTVFRLTQQSQGWILVPLYSFDGGNDGSNPMGRITVGPSGELYGTTSSGGGTGCGGNGCGTVFALQPPMNSPRNALAPWRESVLYRFGGGNDAASPTGDIAFDSSGNLYGTTTSGGSYQKGTVFELTPTDHGWTETILWSFTGGSDGGSPASGVMLDSAGNLYGTTQSGGSHGYGSVFQVTQSGGSWTLHTLYNFRNHSDGAYPSGGLILDASGNLYGSTPSDGSSGGGTIFELTPQSNGSWTFTLLYGFSGQAGGGPQASFAIDTTGALYGTAYRDGAHGFGSVVKLAPSNHGWVYADLHDFVYENDGAEPDGNLVLDSNGNMYGTASTAGEYGYGVIFEISTLDITTTSLPSGVVNRSYSATLTVQGGVPPYSWSLTGGNLPAGLSLSSGGTISGTPTAQGNSSFTVQVSDSEQPPATASASLSITIQSGLQITTTSLPAATVDLPYNATLAATGGVPPYTWSITQGSLPGGLTLNSSTGQVSGTPTVSGNFNFTVQATDSGNPPATATAPLALTVNPPSVALSWTASGSPGVIGYNIYRSTTNGGPYTKINSSLDSTTTYTDLAVQSGNTYYYVTTAVNSQGQESSYSNQASATVP